MNAELVTNCLRALSTRIEDACAARKITPRALAFKVEVPPTTLYRYITGDRVPRLENLISISKCLGVSLDWLLGLSDNRDPSFSPDEERLRRQYNALSPDDKQIVDMLLIKTEHENP